MAARDGIVNEQPQRVPAMADTMQALRRGLMRVEVKKVSTIVPLDSPYVRLSVAGKNKSTTVADHADGDWNEHFDFHISFHSQLFSTLQIDLYQANIFVPDRFCGRAEIRLSKMQDMPESFTTWIELRQERLPSYLEDDLQQFNSRNPSSLGAVQVSIQYTFQRLADIEPDRTVELYSKRHLTSVQGRRRGSSSDDDQDDDPDDDNQANKHRPGYVSSRADEAAADASTLVSTVNGVLSTIRVAPRTRETLINVLNLVEAFNQGFEHVSHTQWLWAALLLDRYFHNIEIPRTNDIVQDRCFFATALYYKKYAMAAYGWRGLTFFRRRKSFWSGFSEGADKATALEYLSHLAADDLLAYEFRSAQVFQPSYFIVHDKKERAIVLTLRGTMNATDTITDLICDYTVLGNGGLVHRGMKVAADFLLATVYSTLVEFLIKYEADTLAIVGHSYGAGSGAVFTICLAEYGYLAKMRAAVGRDIKVKCYAFAPPPVVDMDLSKKHADLIETFVFENDFVCRLNYGSVIDLRCLMIAATQLVKNHNFEILKLMKPASWQSNQELFQQMFAKLEVVRKRLAKDQSNPKLYLPGTVYHIRKAVTRNGAAEPNTPAETSEPSSAVSTPVKSLSTSAMDSLGLSSIFGVLSFPVAPRISAASIASTSSVLGVDKPTPTAEHVQSSLSLPDVTENNITAFPFRPVINPAPGESSQSEQQQQQQKQHLSSSTDTVDENEIEQANQEALLGLDETTDAPSQLSSTETSPAELGTYIIERSNIEHFVEIMIKRSMFLDHLPSSYEDALASWLSGDADDLGIDV
ncbi:hypothetical protein RI367_005591 [Sorochytrium milnesiophthora]